MFVQPIGVATDYARLELALVTGQRAQQLRAARADTGAKETSMTDFVASTKPPRANDHDDPRPERIHKPHPKQVDPSKPTTGDKATPKRPAAEIGVAVGSDRQATFLSDGAGSTVANGEAGFSRRMLMDTNGAANAMNGFESLQLHHLVPEVSEAEQQANHRAKDAEHQKERSAEFFNTPSVTKTYLVAGDWCKEHGTQIQTDSHDEQVKFAAFNTWVPRANGFFGSLTRLRAQEQMLGVTDPERMVQQLLLGIGDASKVAARMQLAHDQGHAAQLNVPASDGALDELVQEATQAGSVSRTAYLGFQQNALAQEEDETHHEGDKASARLAKINEAKRFVKNAGKTIELAMSVVDGAPSAVSTATDAVRRGDAALGAWANKRQIMNGERQTHNPTYVTTNAAGTMIVRNVQTGTDRAMTTKPGDPYAHTPSPEGPGFSLPSGISDVMGKLADFAFAEEVATINSQLEQIKSRCEMIHAVFNMNETKIRAETFQNALNAFAIKCNALQRRMAARRQQYLEFGVQLDNFARTDFGSQKANLGPAKGHEKFATVMTVVSTIREVVTIGKGALSSFDSPRELRPWIRGIFERRERMDDDRADIAPLEIPGKELQQMVTMYEQVSGFEDTVVKEVRRLEPVESAAAAMLGQLSQGESGSTSGGRY